MVCECDHRLFLNTNMAEKPEARRIQYNALLMSHISWPPDEMFEKFQRLPMEFCQPICREHNRWDPDIGRHWKYKWRPPTGSSYISAELQLIPSNLVSHVGFSCILSRVGRHQKHRYSRWNRVSICCRTWNTTSSGFQNHLGLQETQKQMSKTPFCSPYSLGKVTKPHGCMGGTRFYTPDLPFGPKLAILP